MYLLYKLLFNDNPLKKKGQDICCFERGVGPSPSNS